MFIFSHYLVFHNKPRSHYQLIYTISPPQHCQLNKAKGFLRSHLTDLSLICSTALQSPITGASKPPTTSPDKAPSTTALLSQRTVCYKGGWRTNRVDQIEADGSEWVGLEAGGDNEGKGTQVTPAEWEAVTWIVTQSLKSTAASQMMLNTYYSSVLNSAPAVTTHPCINAHTHSHTDTINLHLQLFSLQNKPCLPAGWTTDYMCGLFNKAVFVKHLTISLIPKRVLW